MGVTILWTRTKYEPFFNNLGKIYCYIEETPNDHFFTRLSDQINDDALVLLVDMLDQDGDGKIR